MKQSDLVTTTYIVTVPAGTMPAQFRIPAEVHGFKMHGLDNQRDQAEFFCFPGECAEIEQYLNTSPLVVEWETM